MPSNGTQSGGEIQSVDKAPICLGCGLISHYIYDEVYLCWDCWDRRNWWQHQGMYTYVTEDGDCKHETPLCPAVQGSVYYLTKDEVVYLDYEQCKRCDGYISFNEFDWRRGMEA